MRSPNEEIIYNAIQTRKPVCFYYQGHCRKACPHCLGSLKQKRRALVYQFGGMTSSGPITELTEKNWRVMVPDEMTELRLIDADWHSHRSYTGPGKLFDDVDIAIPC